MNLYVLIVVTIHIIVQTSAKRQSPVTSKIPKTAYTAWDDNLRHTDMETAEKWFSWLQTHTDFDQLIMETRNGRDYWIHVSCRKNRKANRHQVLRLTKE